MYWTVLSTLSVVTLWQSGRGQPAVARRRMRTLGVAAVVLNLALFVVVGSGGRSSPAVMLVVQVSGALSAMLFLIGFVPPRPLRTLWRRPDVLAFRKAEAGLMRADTAERVATIMLPHAAELVGATAAILVDGSGEVRARHGMVTFGPPRWPAGSPFRPQATPSPSFSRISRGCRFAGDGWR